MDDNCRLRDLNGTVYLIRSGFRHGITSARVFNNYQFDWDDIRPWQEGRHAVAELSQIVVPVLPQRVGIYRGLLRGEVGGGGGNGGNMPSNSVPGRAMLFSVARPSSSFGSVRCR